MEDNFKAWIKAEFLPQVGKMIDKEKGFLAFLNNSPQTDFVKEATERSNQMLEHLEIRKEEYQNSIK